jgi:hypothetical protein
VSGLVTAVSRQRNGMAGALVVNTASQSTYKGRHLYDAADAEEKRAVGKVWESRRGGKCLFAMLTGDDFLELVRTVKPC